MLLSLPQTCARNKQITGQSHVFPPFPVRNEDRAAARSIAGACATLGMIIKVVGLRGWRARPVVGRNCRSAGEWLPCGMVPLGGKGVARRRGRLDIPACIDPQAR